MPFITPITDRTQADVIARNSKAFINVEDWERIYNNAEIVRDSVFEFIGVDVFFPTISTPTTSDFPSVADFNSLLECIDTCRQACIDALPGIFNEDDLPSVFFSWVAGSNYPAPDYVDVNQWENTLLILYTIMSSFVYARVAISGIAVSNAGLTRNSGFRSY
jgi:hypothetical protein